MIQTYLSDAKRLDDDYSYYRCARRAFVADCWHNNASDHAAMFRAIYDQFVKELSKEVELTIDLVFANPNHDFDKDLEDKRHIFHLQSASILPQQPELVDLLDWTAIARDCIKNLFSRKLLGSFRDSSTAVAETTEELSFTLELIDYELNEDWDED
jgi:hypothetical protein